MVVRSRWVVEVWGVVWGVVERGANADVCPMREARIDRIVNALILLFVIVILYCVLTGYSSVFVCMGDGKMIGFVRSFFSVCFV